MTTARSLCIALAMAAQVISVEAATFTTIGTIPAHLDGAGPNGGLLLTNGLLYGATAAGGQYFQGALTATDPVTGTTSVLYSFNPAASPALGYAPAGDLVALNGKLYGVATQDGGGKVFSFDPGTGQLTVVANLNTIGSGEHGTGGLVVSNGRLYGVMASIFGSGPSLIYSVDPTTGTIKIVHPFKEATEGTNPSSPLTVVNGILYGVTTSAIFSLDTATHTFTILHTFGSVSNDGSTPFGPLAVVNGKLYGATQSGTGSAQAGTDYEVDPATGAYTIVNVFGGTGASACSRPTGPLLYQNGLLYGAVAMCNNLPPRTGAVYQLNPSSGAIGATFASVGATLAAGQLVTDGNSLFFPAALGPSPIGSSGGIYRIGLAQGNEVLLHEFVSPDVVGESHSAGLIQSGAKLYGTSLLGGDTNHGSVFVVNTVTRKISTLYSFTAGPDGGNPAGELLLLNGMLYGTATTGGNGCGVVFSLNPVTRKEKVLHAFSGNDGAAPAGPLLPFGGLLYGLAPGRCTSGGGTLFAVDPATGATSLLHTFGSVPDAIVPQGGLAVIGTTLYGLSYAGGSGGAWGAVFAYDTQSQTESVVYSFSRNTGYYPAAGPVAANGLLYGTTSRGGAADKGTVFSFDPATGTQTELTSFSAGGSGVPAAPVTLLNGMIYGTNTSGARYSYDGAIYGLSITGGTATGLHVFTGAGDGQTPDGGLLPVGTTLYGTTSITPQQGNAAGTVFKYHP